jgi:hypothetical protein
MALRQNIIFATDMKKMIKEYGGKEKYASKAAKMKHEKSESKKTERKEKAMMAKKKKK